MSLLNVPDLLRGKWEHAVFLTYGLDIPLFENGFSRQLPPSCRNKILIADGRRFLAASNGLAQAGRVRHLNRSYVADGVLSPNAMHAKAILLANAAEGRLLVGSGNLGMQGYASKGELFSRYEYGPDDDTNLSAFLSIRALLDALIKNQELGRAAVSRIDHLLEHVPWIHLPFPNRRRLVLDNLTLNLFEQFQEAIGSEPVKALTVLSPFFDPHARALAKMLDALQPERTRILVQPKRVQVDVVALHQVVSNWHGKVEVCPISLAEQDGYIHAKLYIAQTNTRIIGLQGSPNLSQVAMFRTFPNGNLETANLLDLAPDAAEALLSHLTIGEPIVDILSLQVQASEEDERISDSGFCLLRCDLDENLLTIEYRGDLPPVDQVRLRLGDKILAWTTYESTRGRLIVELATDSDIDRNQPLVVRLEWGEIGARQSSNSVYAHNLLSLGRALEVDDRESQLHRFGDIGLDDLVLEQILAELENTLVLDRASLWSMTTRRIEDNRTDGQGEALRLDDIDDAAIRSHPKMQQYLRSDSYSTWRHRGRLQMILSTITGHFDALRNLSEVPLAALSSNNTSNTYQTEEEAEEAEKETEEARREAEARRWSDRQRVQRVLLNFFERYFRGIRDKEFQQRAGPEVMTTNFRIVSFLIWRLMQTGHLSLPETIKAFIQCNEWFWSGGSSAEAYWWSLSDEERAAADTELRREHLHATILASLFKAAVSIPNLHEELKQVRVKLRDIGRSLLALGILPLSEDLIEDMWVIVNDGVVNPAWRASDVVEIIRALVEQDSRDEFLRWVEDIFGLGVRSCKIERVGVQRPSIGREDKVDQLVLGKGDSVFDEARARLLLQEWMRREHLKGPQSGSEIRRK